MSQTNLQPFIKLLRPLLLVNGVSALRTSFDKYNELLVIDGIQGDKSFHEVIPLADIEAALTLQPDKLNNFPVVSQTG
jgi:hypothetical protein